MARTCFRNPWWHAVLLAFASAAALFVAYLLRAESIWLLAFFLLFGVLCAVGCVESRIAFLRLESESLELFSNFRRKRLAKHAIQSINWAKGSGASLKLASGRWLELPSFGVSAQSLANSVRAWLAH